MSGININSTPHLLDVNTNLGTDGATPPSIPGTGVRGWLRSIYDKLSGTLVVSISNSISTTQSTTTVASSTSSTLLVSSNANRKQVTITNYANKRMYICFFTPATTSTPFFLDKEQTWIFPVWKGAIYGIWDAGTSGNAQITEENP